MTEPVNSQGESPAAGLQGILQACYVCLVGQFRGHVGEQAHEQVNQHGTAEGRKDNPGSMTSLGLPIPIRGKTK